MSQELSDMIRSAINASKERIATIAQETNIPLSALREFMDGADLHLTSATKIAAYLGLELKPNVRKRVAKRPVKVMPPREEQAFKKGRIMKPTVELVEDQAMRAYFRRYGASAQQPNSKATKVFEQDGKHFIRLSNVNGPLVTYRITQRKGGGWKLSYVEEKHEREIK